MKIVLSLLALLFGLEDLLGRERANRIERLLIHHAFLQLTALRRSLALLRRPASLVPATVGSLVLCLWWVPVVELLAYAHIRYSELIALLLLPTLMIGLSSAMNLVKETFGRVEIMLARQWEERLANWIARVVQAVDDHYRSYADIKPMHPPSGRIWLIVPFLLAIALATFISSTVVRLCIFIALVVVWAIWAIPVLALNALAQRFGNPSFLKVGKYLLLIISFLLLLW